jgi:hypothetical protein
MILHPLLVSHGALAMAIIGIFQRKWIIETAKWLIELWPGNRTVVIQKENTQEPEKKVNGFCPEHPKLSGDIAILRDRQEKIQESVEIIGSDIKMLIGDVGFVKGVISK